MRDEVDVIIVRTESSMGSKNAATMAWRDGEVVKKMVSERVSLIMSHVLLITRSRPMKQMYP